MMSDLDLTKLNHIPFHVICSANQGDVEAINYIISHYSGYITTLATRQHYNEIGNAIICVDDSLKRRLESKLVSKILTFRI